LVGWLVSWLVGWLVGWLIGRLVMAYQDIEDSRMYQRAERVADRVWNIVITWDVFARDTIGAQLARSIDSIGANIAEGSGRYHINDVIRFCHFARGSLRESRYWLKRAASRDLITAQSHDQLIGELTTLAKELNAYINFQRNRSLKETEFDYTFDNKSPIT
jgi:four helix bundle protein